MKKYPVTSNGVVYRTEIVTSFLGTAVEIYLGDEKVGRIIDTSRKYKNDYIGMVKAAVREYEKRKSEKEEKERIEAENLRKFEEWDGDCRE